MWIFTRAKHDENRDFAMGFVSKVYAATDGTFKVVQWAAVCGLLKFLGDKTGDVWLQGLFFVLALLLGQYLLFRAMSLLPALPAELSGQRLTIVVAGYFLAFCAINTLLVVAISHAVLAVSQNYQSASPALSATTKP
jgi:hypothetical protein